jgi:hypothetical protein
VPTEEELRKLQAEIQKKREEIAALQKRIAQFLSQRGGASVEGLKRDSERPRQGS